MLPFLPSSFDAPPLRVAHLVRPAEGGMRVQVRSLLAAFPHSLLAAAPETCQFCAGVVAAEDCFTLLPAKRPDRLLVQGWRAGKWAKKRFARILHGHGLNYLPLFASAQIASGLPLVFTLHNLVPADLTGLERAIVQFALRRVTRIVAVSEAVAQSARVAFGPIPQMTVVRNGVDTDRFTNPALPTRDAARAVLNLPPDAVVVLCVARLSPEKGMNTLLDAAHIARHKTPRLRVVVVGDGPQKSELERAAHSASLGEIVTFLGARNDVPELLRAADLYVQPSLAEGLGLAAMEAMASGLPVVASRVGGLPEVVKENETGLLVPPGDAPALANALTLLLHDANLREAMGRAGKERAVSQFGTARMTEEMRAVYEDVLANRGLRGKAEHP